MVPPITKNKKTLPICERNLKGSLSLHRELQVAFIEMDHFWPVPASQYHFISPFMDIPEILLHLVSNIKYKGFEILHQEKKS